MSFLIDTNLIALCHKKHLPAKFKAWLRKNEADSFISSVTIPPDLEIQGLPPDRL